MSVSVLENTKPIDGVPQLSTEQVAARGLVPASVASEAVGRCDRALQVWVKTKGLRPAGWQTHPGGWRYVYDVEDVKRWLRENGMPEVMMRRARRGDAAAETLPSRDPASMPPIATAHGATSHVSLDQIANAARDVAPSDLMQGGMLDTARLLLASVARMTEQLNRTPGENATSHDRDKHAAAFKKTLDSVMELQDRVREEAEAAGDIVPVSDAVNVAMQCAHRIRSGSGRSVQAMTEAIMQQIGLHLQQDTLPLVRSMVRTAIEREFAVFMDEVAAAVEDAA